MLGDLNYKFIFKGKDYFEKEIQNIKKNGSCSLDAIIVYYYKDNKGNIQSFIRDINTDIMEYDFTNYEFISKYYITKLSFNQSAFINREYDTVITIYNIGDFKIFADMEDKNSEDFEKAIKMFKDYDKSYNELSFPFTDEEYLEGNTKILGLNYDGISFR